MVMTDDLSDFLVLLVHTVTDPNAAAAGSAATAASSIAAAPPAANPTVLQPIKFDAATAAHVFQLLGRYKQVRGGHSYAHPPLVHGVIDSGHSRGLRSVHFSVGELYQQISRARCIRYVGTSQRRCCRTGMPSHCESADR
jgi:hypothetical protein